MPNPNPHVYRQWPAQTLTCIDRAQPNPSFVSACRAHARSPIPHLYQQGPAQTMTCIDKSPPITSLVSTEPSQSPHLFRQVLKPITSLVSTGPSPTPPLTCIDEVQPNPSCVESAHMSVDQYFRQRNGQASSTSTHQAWASNVPSTNNLYTGHGEKQRVAAWGPEHLSLACRRL